MIAIFNYVARFEGLVYNIARWHEDHVLNLNDLFKCISLNAAAELYHSIATFLVKWLNV